MPIVHVHDDQTNPVNGAVGAGKQVQKQCNEAPVAYVADFTAVRDSGCLRGRLDLDAHLYRRLTSLA